MNSQWTWHSRVLAAVVVSVALGVALHARQGDMIAQLRDQLSTRYDIVALQGGVGFVPRDRTAGVRLIEVRDGSVSVDGQSLTGRELRDKLGATQMIFGSDYPHAEGLADPKSFVDDLPSFTDEQIRLVMQIGRAHV